VAKYSELEVYLTHDGAILPWPQLMSDVCFCFSRFQLGSHVFEYLQRLLVVLQRLIKLSLYPIHFPHVAQIAGFAFFPMSGQLLKGKSISLNTAQTGIDNYWLICL